MFNTKLSFLKNLILSDCRLNPDDLISLARARNQGRLPNIKHLDISDNNMCVGYLQNILAFEQKWVNLLQLNVKQDVDSTEDFQALTDAAQAGALPNLQRLVLSTNSGSGYLPHCIRATWPRVQFLEIHCASIDGV